MNGPLRVAVAGATGAVGQEILTCLESSALEVAELVPLASARSAGKTVRFGGQDVVIQELTREAFAGCQLALFAASGGVSREAAPWAVEAGAVVIDNSSVFRMEPEVPLVVPEVNPEAAFGHRGIIANPNCSTIVLVLALAPLRGFGLRQVIVSTYQAVSGAGAAGLDELRAQRADAEAPSEVFAHRIDGNLIPLIDTLQPDAYSREELKMLRESRKILGLPELALSATCVRVPLERCHSEAAHLFFERPITPDQARALLAEAPGLVLIDEPAEQRYPTPLDFTRRDEVGVGRVRQQADRPNELSLWVVGDQLLKGAALNAVQIAELLAADQPARA